METLQIVQLINSPLLSGSVTISRVPDGSILCLETMVQKLLMVPFGSQQDITAERRDEEVQIARRLASVSSRVYFASTSSVACIVASPWFLQADAFLDAKRIEEALQLADKASRNMDVQFDAERLVQPSLYSTNPVP